MPQPDEPVRRRDLRHPLVLQVAYPGRSGELASWTENLSASGLFVRTDELLQVGDHLALEISFPGLLDPLALEGVVAWIRPQTMSQIAGVGVQIVSPTGKEQLRKIAAIAGDSPLASPGGTFRILLVEDNEATACMYRRVLENFGAAPRGGIEVRLARNGQQALEALKDEPADLIVTDLYMPVMDGLQMVSLLRTKEQGKRTPVLMITCGGGDERTQAKAIGVDAYLEKPVSFAQIIETMICLRHLQKIR
jgi:uncharacterized protein (TIGR02266 family)